MTNMISTYWKLHKLPIVLMLLSVIIYYLFSYHLERTEFYFLVLGYGTLFFLCYKLIQFEKWNFKFLLFAGLAFRFSLFQATPNLSEDFYRFIWDGFIILQGINPYEFLPEEIIGVTLESVPQASEIIAGMSELSRNNYSNYPPLNQLFFALAALLGGKSIAGTTIALRGLLILADLGVVYFGRKLLKQFNCSPHLIFWYFLNPLVILELTGNLHFEGVMLFFFLWAIYLIHSGKWAFGAVIYGFAISVKLIPLIFLPLFLPYLQWKKSMGFYVLVGLSVAVTTLPFLSPQLLNNYSQTLALWFTNFEFNASLYNIVEQISAGFGVKPWDLIKVYGKIVSAVVVLFVIIITWVKKPRDTNTLLLTMLWVLTFYYIVSATVHPWYLIFLIVLSIFTDYRYPLFWSAVVILSYSAYDNPEYTEYPLYLVIEYSVVFALLFYEIFRIRKEKALNSKNITDY